MSGTVVLEQESGQGASRQQPNQPQQQQRAAPAVELVEEPAHTGPSPEEALAASRKAIEQAEATARAATASAQQTQAELARVRASQQQDQAAVLSSAVEASTAERDRHAHAWQAAMEAGDFAAAAKHQSEMMMATSRLDRAAAELAVAKAGHEHRQQQGGQQQPQAGNGVSPASQAWINSKREFNKHRDALIMKHQDLVNDGVQVDSPRYFRELDGEYDRLINAQQGDSGAHRDMGNQRQFDGAPPSRGGGASSGGGTVQTLLGPVSVRTVNGQTHIQIPQHLREDFDNGAKVTGMSTAEYAMEQVNIARERAAGGTGGLISEEGRKYQ